jgi:hypothetical protein
MARTGKLAQVAAVVDASRIALNVGSDEGVAHGDDVTVWKTITVKDPNTKEVLGSTKVANAALRVETVEPKFCVATTFSKSTMSSALFGRAPKISGASSHSDDVVNIKVGDEVTVYVTELTSDDF